MTSLLVRPDRTETPVQRPRPLVLVATGGGLLAAGGPLLVLAAIGVIGWFISDAGAHGTPSEGMRVAALAWLAGHGAGLTVGGVQVTIVPLGLTLLAAWSTWRCAGRVGDLVSGHGPDADRISDGERDLTVPVATLCFVLAYGAVAVVTASLAGTPETSPSTARVVGATVLLGLLVALPAIATGSGRAAIWLARVHPAVRSGVAVAGRVVVWFLVAATLLWVAALVASWGDAATTYSRLHLSPSEAGLFTLLNAAFAPNATLLAGSWLLGPGFVMGGATLVSPSVVVLGPLPLVPLLAALPDTGPVPSWAGLALGVPPLLAAVAAYRALARRPMSWDHTLLAGCGGGILAGVGFAVLASRSGGAAGPGRMQHVGPLAADVLVHAVTAMGVGALLGAAVLVLVRRRGALESAG
jgi:hypothetical protein